MRRLLFVLLAALAQAQEEPFRFAVIGDTGTGGKDQIAVARQLDLTRQTLPFTTVVMMGDNLYGRERPKDYVKKFEAPYASLLNDGVKFYASLGNHDNPKQRFYEGFHMGGQRFYSFQPHSRVRFFALDSTDMTREQVAWLDAELAASPEPWKIAFFHHPLYSSGDRHGPSVKLRQTLEPIFLKHNVSLVLSGHEHFYERLKPQQGIPYFIVGSSARLRKGNIRKTDLTAQGFDRDNAFLILEIEGDTLRFQAISKTGLTVDSGSLERPLR